jgi:hypothetical protein
MMSSGSPMSVRQIVQHLLLAARQHTSGGIGPRGEVGKNLQHVLEPPFSATPGILNAKDQVLPHRQARKDVPVFGNVAKAQMGDPIARQSGNIMALELYGTPRRNLSHDGFNGRGASDTIAPQEADDLAGFDRHIDALHRIINEFEPDGVANDTCQAKKSKTPR